MFCIFSSVVCVEVELANSLIHDSLRGKVSNKLASYTGMEGSVAVYALFAYMHNA